MLRCETDTPEMEAEVRKAFEAYNAGVHQGGFQYDFEHGQWHVTCLACGAQWSVNDAAGDDFDFEQISEGDEFCSEQSADEEECSHPDAVVSDESEPKTMYCPNCGENFIASDEE